MPNKNNTPRKRGRPFLKQELNMTDILDCSLKLFAKKGFAGTQLQEIAKQAGISKSLLNYHFQNKDTLWKQALIHLTLKLTTRIEEVRDFFQDLEGIALLKSYNRQFIYFSAKHPEFYQIVFHELSAGTEQSKWLVENILQPVFAVSDPLLKEASKTHKNIPIANYNSILIGAANTFFSQAYHIKRTYGIDPFDEKEIEQHVDIVNALLFPS